WSDAAAFYAARNGAPVWTKPWAIGKRASDAEALFAAAPAHGLSPSNYGVDEIRSRRASLERAHQDGPAGHAHIAEFETQLTAALLQLGRDVALGRSRPDATDPRWKARRA